MTQKIIKVAGSPTILFNSALMKSARLEVGDQVNVELHAGGVISISTHQLLHSRMISRVRVVSFLLCCSTLLHAATYFPPPDSSGGWRTATTTTQVRENAAMGLPRLEQAWEFTQRCTQNAGLLVVRHGWLVFEKYVGRAGRNVNPDVASTGKAYTSIACGIMLQEFRDKIPEGLDTKVLVACAAVRL